MRVKLLLFSVLVLFLVSCTSQQEIKKQELGLEIPNEFDVEQENNLGWEEASRDERQKLNELRALRDDEEDLEEFEYESRLSNVRMSVDGETIIGYDEDLDNPDFKEVR
ncbi:hypothetical protein ISS07_03385 [Candidatus Woesearchaeota archaeon]|nr:hypothetical protein [Candidatus Woesearchaeota archaeon]